ncbi:MAG TPA: hypothetical protein VMU33_15420 [Burkholderiaceae bacterium]|nr:hypothetical protein [Burkholderiaceae bacterium]
MPLTLALLRRALASPLSLAFAATLVALAIVGRSPAAPSLQPSTFQSVADLSAWTARYYLNPEPGRLGEALRLMDTAGLLDSDDAAPGIAGFLSGVVRRNPASIATIQAQLQDLPEERQAPLVLALIYAATPAARDAAAAAVAPHPRMKRRFQRQLDAPPTTVEQIALEEGPWVLDALWGDFMATGDRSAVERVIGALAYADGKEDTARESIGAAAAWSLASNATQDARVLQICEEALPQQRGIGAAQLKDVIAKARAARASRTAKSGGG